MVKRMLAAEDKLLDVYEHLSKKPKGQALERGSRMLTALVVKQANLEAQRARLHQQEHVARLHRDTVEIARAKARYEDDVERRQVRAEDKLVRECARFVKNDRAGLGVRPRTPQSLSSNERNLRHRRAAVMPPPRPQARRPHEMSVEELLGGTASAPSIATASAPPQSFYQTLVAETPDEDDVNVVAETPEVEM
jgi:hypothetical protein